MRVVCWGGPLHDQVVDVPTTPDGGPLDVFFHEDFVGIVVDGRRDPIGRRPTVRVAYRAMRLGDAPGRTLARDRREPPWWFVYVPENGDPATVQRHLDAARTPTVDGPVRPSPVLVARGRRLADPEHDVVSRP